MSTTYEDVQNMNTEFISVQTLADFLGANETTVREAIRSSHVPYAFSMGKRFIISRAAFLHFHRFGMIIGDSDVLRDAMKQNGLMIGRRSQNGF